MNPSATVTVVPYLCGWHAMQFLPASLPVYTVLFTWFPPPAGIVVWRVSVVLSELLMWHVAHASSFWLAFVASPVLSSKLFRPVRAVRTTCRSVANGDGRLYRNIDQFTEPPP